MPNQTIPGLNSITSPSSAALLWVSDPNASPQDRSFNLANFLAYLQTKPFVYTVSYASGNTFSALTKDTRVIATGAGTIDITAGASVAGIQVTIVNKNVAAGITLNVTTGAASVTMGIGSLTFEWDGAQWNKVGGITLTQVFTSGTGATWKTPWAGSYKVTALGGGGGGGGAKSATGGVGAAAAGGGGGGAAVKTLNEAANATLTYTVGAAGAAGAATPTNGGSGGNTTVGDGTVIITGNGGVGGTLCSDSSTNAPGSAGGSASNGDLNISGNGSGAGMLINLAGTPLPSGIGGGSFLGGGGHPVIPLVSGGSVAGVSGGNYGGGGSGGSVFGVYTAAGGAGVAGVVVIEF